MPIVKVEPQSTHGSTTRKVKVEPQSKQNGETRIKGERKTVSEWGDDDTAMDRTRRDRERRDRQKRQAAEARAATMKRKREEMNPNKKKEPSKFLCTVKYRSKLDPPPIGPRLLKYPHPEDRLTRFAASSLEMNFHWELHSDCGFAIPIDLVDPMTYEPESGKSHTPEDQRLLQLLTERQSKKSVGREGLTKGQHRNVSWMFQPRLLDGRAANIIARGALSENQTKHEKMLARPNKKRKLEHKGDPTEVALSNVMESFEVWNELPDGIPTHPDPKKADLKAEEVYCLFPDDRLQENHYTQVSTERDPSQAARKTLNAANFDEKGLAERAWHCTTHSLMVQSDAPHSSETWLSLFAPTDEKLQEADKKTLYDWTCEFVPTDMKTQNAYFIALSRTDEYTEATYARMSDRILMRIRDVDPNSAGQKPMNPDDTKHFSHLPRYVEFEELDDEEEYDDDEYEGDVDGEQPMMHEGEQHVEMQDDELGQEMPPEMPEEGQEPEPMSQEAVNIEEDIQVPESV